jgi:predicted TIM-barrel fold metal-dependent hydrolase
METREIGVVDVTHVLFSRGNDYVDFIDTNEMCRSADARSLPEHGEGDASVFVLCPPTYYSLSNGIADNRRINDLLLGIGARSGDRVIGVAEPKYGEQTRKEIRRIAALGATGVVWSPRAQGVFADDAHMASLCEFVAGFGMISMIRTAPYSINESLARLWHLAVRCPALPLVVLGAFASWENIQTIQHNNGGPANLFYDISGIAADRDLEGTVAAIGAGRLLFGSGGHRFLRITREIVEHCSFDDGAKRAILSGNAAKLLKL